MFDTGGGSGTDISGGGGSGVTKINIQNPIGPDTLIEFVEAILGIIIQIGIPVLVVMIVYVGFKFVMAQGNDGKLAEAKTAFYWTIIGAAIVLGAFVISTVIQTTINNLGA
ncbi:MAG: hypothetical protein A2114_00310 [Candidatus Vogelbacteria bacterium GWA1_51_14]|uniref:Uncharacterized protein n=1 Tax=Candidatus Vogelbacteria bacterium GWA1_51_14 TaxID=1802435 RepID=A0A1G2Q8X5_9BACT|nr:MAG: hypothetical protein A2114_00310 [Candidatus Vogelbacteria bacterium GWA1_51_14]